MLLDKSRGRLELSPNLGLRIKVKIDPADDEAGRLAELPWELLCDGKTSDFFALSRQMSVVRYLDVPRSSHPIPFTPPLRVLAVSASPKGLDELNLAEEERRLESLNRNSSGVLVRFLQHASIAAVREALSKDTYHVLHFMGHGSFDPESGEGMLGFESSDGSCDLVSGKLFAAMLQDFRSLGVVVLNACNTARARHQREADPFRGVANALVLGGVPAVVAMQQPISDLAAIGFSSAFYRLLACGASIDEALTEGRQALRAADPHGVEWATPVLFLRTPEGHVFRSTLSEPSYGPPFVPPTPPRSRPILAFLAGVAATALLMLMVSIKNPEPTNVILRPVAAKAKTVQRFFQTKTDIYFPSISNIFQIIPAAKEASIATPSTTSKHYSSIQAPKARTTPLAPSRSEQELRSQVLKYQPPSPAYQIVSTALKAPAIIRPTSSAILPENAYMLTLGRFVPCTKQNATIAFFQDEEGKTSPLRDTFNIDNDMDWLGLHFTESDGSSIRLGVLGLVKDSVEVESGNYARRVSVPAVEMQQILSDALYASKRFDVIEPKRLREIQEQQTQENEGSNTISIMNIGKASGARYLIYGTVSDWSLGSESLVVVSLSFADIDSGQTFFVTSERAFIGKREIGLHASESKGVAQFQDPYLLYAARACANKAALKIVNFLRTCTNELAPVVERETSEIPLAR